MEVRPSSRADKKLDVFKQGRKVASIGAKGYLDYASYLELKGKEYADERRRLYYARHGTSLPGTAGWYAAKLLW